MNSQQESKSTDSQSREFGLLRVYILCVSGLGAALLLWSLSQFSSFPQGMLLFTCLVVAAELTTIELLMPQILFSISSAVTFATLLLFGPLPAALAAMVGGLVITLVAHRRQARSGRAPLWQRALFNAAVLGLAVGVAGGAHLLAGGTIGKVALLSNLLPMVLAAASFEIVNAGLVVGAVSLQTGQAVFQTWRQNVSWAAPMNVLGMVIGGGGLALGYQIAGILGVVVFFLPVALTIYAHRLYVKQTKARMARLEEMIAERIDELRKANEKLGTEMA
jgi:hypothetical protein